MLRHAAGYKLANDGQDTRAIQHYLGHKNISHTVRYTELSPERFKDFWQDWPREPLGEASVAQNLKKALLLSQRAAPSTDAFVGFLAGDAQPALLAPVHRGILLTSS